MNDYIMAIGTCKGYTEGQTAFVTNKKALKTHCFQGFSFGGEGEI